MKIGSNFVDPLAQQAGMEKLILTIVVVTLTNGVGDGCLYF
jgi:hypothetical protein